MHPDFKFCDSRAIEAYAQAEAEQLDNVRERLLRSAAAWRAMADRAAKVEKERRIRDGKVPPILAAEGQAQWT